MVPSRRRRKKSTFGGVETRFKPLKMMFSAVFYTQNPIFFRPSADFYEQAPPLVLDRGPNKGGLVHKGGLLHRNTPDQSYN